uniref:Uncharacterized protein n=1 Tax=Timema cristinae TaxID=61476 RepID=A0A7R9GYX5_TIMCR|nr:unnamed protein product [Timema cristinae]
MQLETGVLVYIGYADEGGSLVLYGFPGDTGSNINQPVELVCQHVGAVLRVIAPCLPLLYLDVPCGFPASRRDGTQWTDTRY